MLLSAGLRCPPDELKPHLREGEDAAWVYPARAMSGRTQARVLSASNPQTLMKPKTASGARVHNTGQAPSRGQQSSRELAPEHEKPWENRRLPQSEAAGTVLGHAA